MKIIKCDKCKKDITESQKTVQMSFRPDGEHGMLLSYEQLDLCQEHYNEFIELFIKFKENSK